MVRVGETKSSPLEQDMLLTEEELFQIFPNLTKENHRNTSPDDYVYNCMAWACGDTKHWWEPSGEPWHFWIHTQFSYSIDSHLKAFSIVGFKERSDSDEFEPEFEKVAIYIGADGLPKHFARQKENGLWTSKLGEAQDIEHDTLEAIECDDYGKAEIILKKPRKVIKKVEKSPEKSKSEFENFKTLAKNLIRVPKEEIDNTKNQAKKNQKKKSNK